MSALTRVQREFLRRFFERGNSASFYLTGGGALAAFYTSHRLSLDVDLFTLDQVAWTSVEADLRAVAADMGAGLEFQPALEPYELHRASLRTADGEVLKIDIIRDAPPHFGEIVKQADGIRVDSLENIAVGKLLALYGRAYPRDFVDVYFLAQSGVDLERIMKLARQKDPGFERHYFADTIRQAARLTNKLLPNVLKPVRLETLKAFFLKWADQLYG